MSLQVTQVAAKIERDYQDLIDLSDVGAHAQRAHLHTRGLAALAVQMVTGRDPVDASAAIVDGGDDNGIDAIWVDEATPWIVLVQSKWRQHGRGGIDLGDMHKFVDGLKALTEERFERFNAKVKPFAAQLTAALREVNLRITVVVVTTGASTLGEHSQRVFDDVAEQMNDPTEQVELRVLGLAEVHRFLVEGMRVQADVDVTLANWGPLDGPYQAFYGAASASEVAGWYEQHGDRLFDGNIRRALGLTSANRSIVATLRKTPGHFWYFNNGITVLCQKIEKTAAGGVMRTFGQFSLTGITVVNGAQTVASIAEAARHDPAVVEQAQVLVRLISLDDVAADFGEQVTRATNTQNTVEARDFVALDSLQSTLREDFALRLGKRYSVKRGEDQPVGAEGCSVVEAADALACAHPDPSFAVLAKRERGMLLETGDGYYRQLFTSDLAAELLWRHVEVLRLVDAVLAERKTELAGRAKTVAVHGNRLTAHLVFRAMAATDEPDERTDRGVRDLTRVMLGHLIDEVEAAFPDNYVTSLFKNTTKCRQLATVIQGRMAMAG
ncbi:AIPR family protein [Natronosporangium hydrolyticum]|uniref:AIPR family protein n=1 Tax=Natronosporangium hydrolyticum TaxID=2811111 RepID=A0A895YN10_9ACTN|nr:AIPR family protein [Natronosporangium hydrolyticum]QSB16693.1 AIPR family protein [Natronosporangium hydrolyticum]